MASALSSVSSVRGQAVAAKAPRAAARRVAYK